MNRVSHLKNMNNVKKIIEARKPMEINKINNVR